ncbi:MAG TPA: protease pro-enzyme activation domain-containing protein, partial [Candidatus Acidoferrales bacterium]|nr:protease pro-enzyme activation domain-containing protein [Candidatus Acidoferrales bacterium]
MIRTASKAFALVLTSALIISGCGGGGHGSSLPATSNTNKNAGGANTTTTLTGNFNYGQALISKLAYQGPAKAGAMTIPVMVKMQNAAGLVQYAASASNPASSNYRHWLTPSQIGAQYGATASDYAASAKYLQSYGLRVAGWPQREILTVSGSTSQFARAFGTSFGNYTFMGKKIVAANSAAHVPSTVPIVAAPLIGAFPMRSYLIHGNNAAFYGYSPQQMASGFDSYNAWRLGYTGADIHVAIIGTGPVLNSDGKSDDLAALSSYWHAQVAAMTQVNASPQPATTANGGTGTGAVDYTLNLAPAPAIAGSPTCAEQYGVPGEVIYGTDQTVFVENYQLGCNPEDGEAQLDSQSIASLAPGASVLFYQAFNQNEACFNTTTGDPDPSATGATCPTGDIASQFEGIEVLDDSVQQVIADDTADAVSMSFGGPENVEQYYGYINTPTDPGPGQIEMASMAAEGIAVFASSGDDGAWECFDPSSGDPLGTACASYPASDPNVVAVGGVNIPLDESGNLTGAITAWADNTTLGGDGTFGNNVGSGGGVSTIFSAPAW